MLVVEVVTADVVQGIVPALVGVRAGSASPSGLAAVRKAVDTTSPASGSKVPSSI